MPGKVLGVILDRLPVVAHLPVIRICVDHDSLSGHLQRSHEGRVRKLRLHSPSESLLWEDVE